MFRLIKKDTIAAQDSADYYERVAGRSLTVKEKRTAIEIMQQYNPAVAEGLKEIWAL